MVAGGQDDHVERYDAATLQRNPLGDKPFDPVEIKQFDLALDEGLRGADIEVVPGCVAEQLHGPTGVIVADGQLLAHLPQASVQLGMRSFRRLGVGLGPPDHEGQVHRAAELIGLLDVDHAGGTALGHRRKCALFVEIEADVVRCGGCTDDHHLLALVGGGALER